MQPDPEPQEATRFDTPGPKRDPIPIDVILFDWGGTLAQVTVQDDRFRAWATQVGTMLAGADDRTAIADLVKRVLTAEARAGADPELREGDPAVQLREWTATLRRPIQEEKFQEAIDLLARTWIGSLEALPGAPETLAELYRRGFRIGLVSNCMLPWAVCREELTRQGLCKHLHFTVFSSQVGFRKPAPAIYQEALRQAFNGQQPPSDLSRVLFVGDSPIFDVVTPAAMGMKTALVGHNLRLWQAADYQRAQPTLRIDSVTQLPPLLTRG